VPSRQHAAAEDLKMAVLRIAKMGNPVLLQKAAPVADPTATEIRRLAADMQETIEDIGASGLAAPQVFVAKRIVVYRIIAARIPEGAGLEPRPWTVMVNPVITPKSAVTTPVWERCLSVPGLHGKVPRFMHVTISYQDLQGKTVRHDARSSWAALLQHECDHLDGILYPMRMTDLSLLAYNDEPGPLAREVAANPKGIDPLFIDLVERWPGRARWNSGSGS
jgi:peptide deformylase